MPFVKSQSKSKNFQVVNPIQVICILTWPLSMKEPVVFCNITGSSVLKLLKVLNKLVKLILSTTRLLACKKLTSMTYMKWKRARKSKSRTLVLTQNSLQRKLRIAHHNLSLKSILLHKITHLSFIQRKTKSLVQSLKSQSLPYQTTISPTPSQILLVTLLKVKFSFPESSATLVSTQVSIHSHPFPV